VELDAITENRVHDPIKGHMCVPGKLVVVKGDTHTVGRCVDHDMAKDEHQGSGRGSRRGFLHEARGA
jgi:hypothetical protein